MVTTKIEAVLFAAAKPISVKQLAKHLEISEEVAREAVEDIAKRFNRETSGIHVMQNKGEVQLVTNAQTAEDVNKFLKKESSGPLTRPALETLTIIAYRGPITKPEIEVIRGVNCSLILRNLMIRGFIDEAQDTQRLQPVYTVSNEFIRALGVENIDQLPEYESFQQNEKINELLNSEQDNEEV